MKSRGLAIEAFLLRDGHTGVERYIQNLVETAGQRTSGPVTVFILSACNYRPAFSSSRITLKVFPIKSRLLRILFQHFAFPFWIWNFDRVIFTGYMGSLLFPGRRTATVVFDLIALQHPGLVKPVTRWYYGILLPWFLRYSGLVVVPSAKVERDVRSYRPRREILRLQIPVDESFYVPNPPPTKGHRVCNRVLVVGYGEKKKNHDMLDVIAPRFPDVEFLLAGKRPIKREFPTNVKVLGFVPQGELVQMYLSSSALLFLSYAEGYGLPVAEALVSGLPVLCWDVPPLNEFESDLMVLVEPCNYVAMAIGLGKVLSLPPMSSQPLRGLIRWREYWNRLESSYGWENLSADRSRGPA